MKLSHLSTCLMRQRIRQEVTDCVQQRGRRHTTFDSTASSTTLANPVETISLIISDLEPSSLAMLVVSITFVMLTQLSSCLPPLRVAHAEAESKDICAEERTFLIHCLDDDGNVVESFEQPALYLDDDDTLYRCVNPHRVFLDGTFTKEDVHHHLEDDVVKRMALAERWCKENIKEDVSDMVAQILIWKVMEQAGLFADEGAEVTDWSIDGFDIPQVYDSFLKWYEDNEGSYVASGTYWVNGPDTQDVMHLIVEERDGMLQIEKTSSVPSLSGSISAYSLDGARYVVYRDRQCQEPIEGVELTCDGSGLSNAISLDAGTYYVRESAAPRGFETSTNTYAVTVKPGETAQVKVKDKPIYKVVELWAKKEGRDGVEQDTASLEGTQITIRYYATVFEGNEIPADAKPMYTWVATCDADGKFEASSATGDELITLNDKIVCPFGTISIQETKAPEGYLLEGQDPDSPEDYRAPVHVVPIREEGTLPCTSIIDDAVRGGVSIRKVDADTLGAAQGDATLQDIVFDIINANVYPVMVNGTSFGPGETVASITTDENGYAQTDDDLLPIGTYKLKESRSNASMRLSESERTVSITTSNAHKVVDAGTVENEVVRGGLRVGKVSRETSKRVSQGAATLKGTEFAITLLSDQSVVVNGATFKTGDIVCVITTGDDGTASTEPDLLPYGTYLIEEVMPPHGYLPNDNWNITTTVRQDGVINDYSNEETSVPDQVIRGGIHFKKVDHDTGNPMSGIPFKITSLTTGESHLVVSDAEGLVDTESAPHSHLTNANDTALQPDGTVDAMRLDASAGTWFCGSSTIGVTPDDQQGALPFDTYSIEELRTTANETKELVSFDVHVSEQGGQDHGTVFNETMLIPQLQTELSLVGSTPSASDTGRNLTYTDTLYYQNLEPGETYVIKSTLHNRDSGDVICEVESEFCPQNTAGTESITFQVEGQLAGSTLVCYEEVTLEDGTSVCSHDDPDDMDQTAFIPAITTHLTDENGRKELLIKDETTLTLVDKVECQNLDPRLTYTLVGTLYDKDTLEPITDSRGEAIRGCVTLVDGQANPTTDVRFHISNIDYIAGRNIVCFEELRQGDLCVAQHCDPNDSEQTVSIPFLTTELCDSHGSHFIANTGNVALKDTVVYGGLTPGVTYEVFGTLYDKWTALPIENAQGDKATSFVSFTPEKASGTIQVTFEIDTKMITGTSIVAFEALVRDGTEVALHADLLDEAQTVTLPSIETEMHDSRGNHVAQETNDLTLTDVVTYKGLDTSCTYTIVGTLMDAKTGQKLKDSKGKVIEVTQRLAPQATDGTCSVRFVLDSSTLKGTRLVAFESLYAGDTTTSTPLATHADLNDELQTVRIVSQSEYRTQDVLHRSPLNPSPTKTPIATPATSAAPTEPSSNDTTQEQPSTNPTATPNTPISSDTPATQSYVPSSVPSSPITQALLPHTADPTPSLVATVSASIILIVTGTVLYHVRRVEREACTR